MSRHSLSSLSGTIALTVIFSTAGCKKLDDASVTKYVALGQSNGYKFPGLVGNTRQTKIRVCANFDRTGQYAQLVGSIMKNWVCAIQSKVTDKLANGIEFVDDTCDVRVTYDAATTRAYCVVAPGQTPSIAIGPDQPTFPLFGTLSHEFGHAFGLGDTYQGGQSGNCIAGQPQSLMCNTGFKEPQQDDIDGLASIYRETFGPTAGGSGGVASGGTPNGAGSGSSVAANGAGTDPNGGGSVAGSSAGGTLAGGTGSVSAGNTDPLAPFNCSGSASTSNGTSPSPTTPGTGTGTIITAGAGPFDDCVCHQLVFPNKSVGCAVFSNGKPVVDQYFFSNGQACDANFCRVNFAYTMNNVCKGKMGTSPANPPSPLSLSSGDPTAGASATLEDRIKPIYANDPEACRCGPDETNTKCAIWTQQGKVVQVFNGVARACDEFYCARRINTDDALRNSVKGCNMKKVYVAGPYGPV